MRVGDGRRDLDAMRGTIGPQHAESLIGGRPESRENMDQLGATMNQQTEASTATLEFQGPVRTHEPVGAGLFPKPANDSE